MAISRTADLSDQRFPLSDGLSSVPVLEEELRLAAPAADGGGRVSLLRTLLVATDSLGAALAATVGAVLAGFAVPEATVFVGVGMALWLLSAFAAGLYSVENLSSWATGVPEAGRQVGLALLLSWPVYGLATVLSASTPIVAPLIVAPFALLLSALGRSFVRARLHRSAPLRQRTIIVGSGTVASQLSERIIRHTEFGLLPIGILDDEPHRAEDMGLPVLGTLSQLRAVIDTHEVDRVIIAFSRASHENLLDCLRACRDKRVAVDVVPRLFEFLGGARSLEQIGDVPLLSIGVPRLSKASRIAKRVLDATAAVSGIVILSPLLAAIAIAIRLESRGPVFFRQRRIGREGDQFEIFKFRSMYQDADRRKAEYETLNDQDDGVMFKIHQDPRVSRVGRLLRRLSLDELPQLLNVIRGEMSIVGPRPLIMVEQDAFDETWHARRLDLRPGLTGPWQISGRSDLTAHEMLRLDFQYVTGWSLARDLEIMLATIPAVFTGRGAY
ncbi:MAG TPA: sugar transferase [Solirubrobacteraceae bacterium]|nr:sugar transferase [Solirubrobacteraceae bacterium]